MSVGRMNENITFGYGLKMRFNEYINVIILLWYKKNIAKYIHESIKEEKKKTEKINEMKIRSMNDARALDNNLVLEKKKFNLNVRFYKRLSNLTLNR